MSERTMERRKFLKENSTILLKEGDGDNRRIFTITKRISGEGASVVCYEAYHSRSRKGILKEFYPAEAYALERSDDGQLIYTEEFGAAKREFERAKEVYLQPYEMLLQEQRKDKQGELATFIPPFKVYYGCDRDGDIVGSVYIWLEEPKLVTFDRVCEEIHRKPYKEPERKLVFVLSAIETLTKCICELHKAGLIHRDIKPSNFGFVKRRNEVLPQTLSMFDVDSICSVYQIPEKCIGTPGYMEPETREGRDTYVTNQTDIYAIGATLFQAIVVSDKMNKQGYVYDDSFYKDLQTLVYNSSLIRVSEYNSHPRLRNRLTIILEKCLARRSERYTACEELLEDISKALYYALPSEIAKKKLSGEKWELKEVEKSFDSVVEKNSKLALQYHLYQNPIYRWGEDDTTLNIMLIGFGNYGQKFLDICLQIGQMPGKELNVKVVSEERIDQEIYLKERTELPRFFCVNGAGKDGEESYGNIDFEIQQLSREDGADNTRILKDLFSLYYRSREKRTPQYIFIALGDNQLNQNAARVCKEIIDSLQLNCCVNYVAEKKEESSINKIKGVFPVYVNNYVKKSPSYKEIERMAFNTHLIWEKELNLNYQTVRRNFRKSYFYDACVSYVLAVKYKLFSMGIDLDEVGVEEAAKLFTDRGLEDGVLIQSEHKRWVVEKICSGWTQISDLEECLECGTKDEKHKRHVCIVRSRAEQKLTTEFQSGGSLKKWDEAKEKELAQLDELDRMSVELHRMYARKAADVKKQNLLNGNNIAELRKLTENHKEAFQCFQEWFSCLKDIWNGDRSKVRLYRGLKETFLASLCHLPREYQYVPEVAKAQLKAFEVQFNPILESMKYIDFKQEDVALVENIPFVLTYMSRIYLAVPYTTGNNTELFSNVAAATVVGPACILYLCEVKKKGDLERIQDSLAYITNYMEKKKFRATVEFAIAYSDEDIVGRESDINRVFREMSKGKVQRVKLLHASDGYHLTETLSRYLRKKKEGKTLFVVENDYASVSEELYREFEAYSFDMDTREFSVERGNRTLTYIKKKPYIRVSDMLAITLSSSESSNQPEFYEDYKKLWEEYRKNSSNWKQLCERLGTHSQKNDILVCFKKKQCKSKKAMELKYILPFVCHLATTKILDFLKEHKMIEAESCLNAYTSDSCKVIIFDRYHYKCIYDQLFSNVYALMNPDAIKIFQNQNDEIKIQFDNLCVKNVSLGNQNVNEQILLLEYFEKNGYVINLQRNNQVASFTYATRKIKELLTTEGKLLEIYVYHKIKDTGYFDDVVSSYEIDWANTQVRNEFDFILTKGFKSLFVECKARKKIVQDFYFKIKGLKEQFGINAKTVLIADTEEHKNPRGIEENHSQRARGNQMEIITVWKPQEIKEIGNTLLQIMNGTYKIKEG